MPGKNIILAVVVGMVAGVVGWGGFNTALHATNRMDFCISCHEMRDNVYVEYQQSAHFQNPSGVRATCPDCHVPRDWGHMLVRKVQASGELFHWAKGSIDSPEKFQAKRHQLAKREWERLRASDSRECRNCHSFDAMAFHKQSIRAARAMRDAAKSGTQTCIDCHKAVAHKMPDINAAHRAMMADLSAQTQHSPPPLGAAVRSLRPLPLRSAPQAEPEGELAAGMAVRVLAIAGDQAQVALTGWRRDGDDTRLYARQGKRMALASLTQTARIRVVDGKTVEDADTGQTWTEARLDAWVALTALTADSQSLWAVAERMADDNCTLCHTRKPAAAYAANDWLGHMNTMKRLTPLTDDEAALLLAYQQSHAKDTAP
ncbi:MAG: NapC/NirT family cytochrome c [Magnetospirillum gryphiswaldense]|nr:NapC/NirT family cytochrome c [Magnetospirillum gryphiswaldense]